MDNAAGNDGNQLMNQIDQNIQVAGPQLVSIPVKELAAKYNNKRELYNFIATDCGIYVPPYANCTTYFLKELMTPRKKRLHTARIRTIHIPQ